MKTSPYLLTIVTVVRNAATEIETTLRSIEALKTSELEYIILDGGSSDGTQDIIARYQHIVDFTKSEADKGIYFAMNEALHYAHGEFILNINAGDYLLSIPWKELQAAQYDGIDLLACAVSESRGHVQQSQIHHPLWNRNLRLYNTLPHQGCIYHTDLFRQYRYDIRYKVFADFDLNQRLYQAGIHTRISPSIIAHHDLRGISNDRRYGKEAFRVVYRNYGLCTLFRCYLRSKCEGLKYRLRHLFS